MNDYIAKPWDILVQTPTLESQRVYRVAAVMLGGLGEEGVVVLESLGLSAPYEIHVPPLMLEAAVCAGVLACVWRETGQARCGIAHREQATTKGKP